MSQPEFNPFDPISAAMGAMHGQNLLAAKDARIHQLEAEVVRLNEEINVYKEGVHKSDNLFKSIGIHVKDDEWVADGITQLIDKVHKAKEEVKLLTEITNATKEAMHIYSEWITLPGDGEFREHLNMIYHLMKAKDEWNSRHQAANNNEQP